VWSHLAD